MIWNRTLFGSRRRLFREPLFYFGWSRDSASVGWCGAPTDEPQSQVDIAIAVLWVELFEIKNINMNIMFN